MGKAYFTGTGNLTRDAELKFTNGGSAVCHFSIATNSKVKKGDSWVDEPSFWDVDLWGKAGEAVAQYLTKGKTVHVIGEQTIERWEKDGKPGMKVKIKADHVDFAGGKTESTGQQQAPEQTDQPPATKKQSRPAVQAPSDDGFSDDLPPF